MREIQKGLYIEQKKNRSVFLMSDGRFMHGHPAAPLEIGEEGFFYPLAAKSKWKWRPVFAPAIAAVATLGLFVSAVLPSEDALAYVQLEMDSSIEFGVDEAIHVISIRELDEGGEKLISRLGDWKGEALDKLIERSIAISVKDDTDKVTITTAAEENAETLETQLEQMVLAASSAAVKRDIDVHVKKATIAQWEKSVEEDVPVGEKVENYTSLSNEENVETDGDAIMDVDKDIKALKTEKHESRVKNKAMDQGMNVESEPAAKSGKGQGPIAKDKADQKPLEKAVEPPAAAKVEKTFPPAQSVKVKPKEKAVKSKAAEKIPAKKPASIEKADSAAKGQPRKAPSVLNQDQPAAEKPKVVEKSKPIQKAKPKQKAKAANAKPKKPIQAEARHSQNQQRKQPVKDAKGGKTGKKQEQK